MTGSRPLRIGITGPIGCGKSTIARALGRRGAVVVDADALAREVTAPGEPALAAVVTRFGSEYLRADGSLDRAALGRLVFSDPAALVGSRVHRPPGRSRPRRAGLRAGRRPGRDASSSSRRSSSSREASRAPATRSGSSSARPTRSAPDSSAAGFAPADVEQRIAAQAGLADRLRPSATRVIDASGSREETKSAVDAALALALAALAGARPARD